MDSYVNPTSDYFIEKINGPFFVDKSNFITFTNSKVCAEGKWMGVSMPRRFGKTMTAKMLAAYYSKAYDNKELFSKLKIGKDPNFEKYLNKFDVIYLDIASLLGNATNNNENNISRFISKVVINELKELYPNYINDDEKYLPSAMSSIYVKTGNKFVTIIDEWDALFRERKDDDVGQKEFLDLLNGLFKTAEATEFTALAYVTGILPIKKYKTESKMNNFKEYSMTSPKDMAPFMGFTDDEVKTLCENSPMDYKMIKQWYDGYILKERDDTYENENETKKNVKKKENKTYSIYSPYSVVTALDEQTYGSHWPKTSSFESLKDPLNMNIDGIQKALKILLSSEEYLIDISTFSGDMVNFANQDDILTLLVHLGYLSYTDRKVRIPNREIKEEFLVALKDNPTLDQTNALLLKSKQILDATIKKKDDVVSKLVDEIHEDFFSLEEYNDEHAISQVITLSYLMAMNSYDIYKELQGGKGRADFVFRPQYFASTPAFVVELKYNDCVDSALDQIKEKHYVKSLGSYKGRVLLVGINYDNDSNSKTYKQHQCKIEEIMTK